MPSSSNASPLLVWALLALAPWPGLAQTTPPAQKVDLRLEARLATPMRVERVLQVKVMTEMVSGKKRLKLPFQFESRLEFVDEFLASTSRRRATSTRAVPTCGGRKTRATSRATTR